MINSVMHIAILCIYFLIEQLWKSHTSVKIQDSLVSISVLLALSRRSVSRHHVFGLVWVWIVYIPGDSRYEPTSHTG